MRSCAQIVLNYAALLEEHKHFELSFQAFEKGVALFKHPHVLQLWIPYLTKFVARYGGQKLERARDLFEQAIDGCPTKDLHTLYLLYGKYEEEHGLVRNAMSVYDRAVQSISLEKRYEVFNLYIAKAASYFGVTKTRDIYEQAVNMLAPPQVSDMCARYANLERKLGEIDRARAIYMHGCQDVNPTTASGGDAALWSTWHEFEVAHGNEDTFREMLRVKRAVTAHFNQARAIRRTPAKTRLAIRARPFVCCTYFSNLLFEQASVSAIGEKRPREEDEGLDSMGQLEKRQVH